MTLEYYQIVVQLFDEKHRLMGSGFLLNEETIITCAHVFKTSDFAMVQIPDIAYLIKLYPKKYDDRPCLWK